MITKSDFLVYIEAPRHFWALKHDQYDLTLSDFDKHLIEQGYIVEKKAREYAIQYLLPESSSNEDDVAFQRTCLDAEFEARADILIRNDQTNKWDLYEVKSVTNPEPEHYYDVTFQYLVFQKQYDIDNVFILHVNNDYVRKGTFDLSQFFQTENVTDKVKLRKEDTILKMKDCVFLSTSDNYKMASECIKPKKCGCKELCFPNLPEDSIYNLSRISEKKILDLRDNDILDIRDIPVDYDLSTNQRVQVEVAKRGVTCIDKKSIKEELDTLEYPLYFLDYETYNSVIPLYDGYKPYQHMVFQYSLHILDSPDLTGLKHYEYVVKTQTEPCRELVADMQQHIGNIGSVIVWSKVFECSRNREMGKICSDFAEFLDDLNGRVYDLMDIFKKNYYVDPRFKGSNSIKDVMPVLVPELDYKTLEVQDGTMAMVGWYKLVYGNLTNDEKSKLLKGLLVYCEQDTLAMVKIWDYLRKLYI